MAVSGKRRGAGAEIAEGFIHGGEVGTWRCRPNNCCVGFTGLLSLFPPWME
jgi:hypothetical protein